MPRPHGSEMRGVLSHGGAEAAGGADGGMTLALRRSRPSETPLSKLPLRTTRTVLALAIAAALPCTAAAQEALVLSGGGSRGLVHVGVFEALAELGYDPDIVVGTSMGAAAGALYAAGYAPEEIRERILAIDWSELFTPTPVVIGPARSVRYPMINFDLDVEELRVARGFIPQWRINRALGHLLFDANARARGDFDRLARRYRAVAADLKTGDVVVLDRGDLARAARASMAVPGVFAPVVWGDRILVDGGIVNNLPTSVAREMGARRVIAVDVGRPPEEIHSHTPLAVLNRALDLIQENTQRDPLPPDALILPELEPGFGARFPADPTTLFDRGRRGTLAELPPRATVGDRGGRPLPVPPDSIHELIIEAPDSALAALARRIFAGIAPGAYDPVAVLEATDQLYTTGLFEAIWPRMVEHPDTGRTAPVLLVRLDAPPRMALAAAAGFENDRGARVWASIDRYSRAGRLPAAFTASVSSNGIERFAAVSARLYPLSRPAIAWTVGSHLTERDVRAFDADAASNLDVLRVGGWGGLELPHILRDRVATAVVRGDWIHEEGGRSGVSVGPLLRFTSLNPDILVVGVPLLLEAESRWGAISYSRLALRGSRAFELGRLRTAPLADVRLTSSSVTADLLPALGDEHAVPGLQWGEVRGRTRAVVGADLAYPVRTAFARLRLRSGTAAEALEDWRSGDWITGAQLGMVWQNPIATVEWGLGFNSRGDRRFDLSLGRYF